MTQLALCALKSRAFFIRPVSAQFIFDRARSGLAVGSGAAGAARVVQRRSCTACLLLHCFLGEPLDSLLISCGLLALWLFRVLDQMSCNLEFHP